MFQEEHNLSLNANAATDTPAGGIEQDHAFYEAMFKQVGIFVETVTKVCYTS